MSNKFRGELSWINPNLLITENKHNKTESFFLGLGVVFNDLKGLILFEKMLIDNYEKPKNCEVSVNAGNYYGIIVQIDKLIASIINEFFIFLKKNADVLAGSELKEVLNRIATSDKQFWNAMVAAAYGKLPKAEDLLRAIMQIRSNFTFHYDHSGKVLKNGYISRFFGKAQDIGKEFAYYSIGDSIENTRFYFSDAAVQESLYIAAGKKPKEISIGDASVEKFRSQIRETVNVMSATIVSLLKNYIQLRRDRPH